ncbi:MAG: glycosyltransferase [Blautia sp.]|nr:glycosyltransferase [Blautia sp.]
MPTILFVCKSDRYSGAENVICTIIKNVSERYQCIYMSADGFIRDKLSELGIKHYLVESVTALSLGKAVKKYKPDIIHANDFSASCLAALYGRKIKVISHLHCNPVWLGKICSRTVIYALVCRDFYRILLVSDSIYDEFIFKKRMGGKYEVIGNPFDKQRVIQEVDRDKAWDDKKYICDLLYVGRLSEEKGVMDFIEIVAKVREGCKNIKAFIVGAGELKEKCEDRIKRLELENNIVMKGFQSNPYNYMYGARVLIVPSLWEGFGLVAVEAMAFGKPVIARKAGGLAGLVTDHAGVLIEDKDFVEKAADAAFHLLADADYYISKSAGAMDRADECDNIPSYIKNIEKIYDSGLKAAI